MHLPGDPGYDELDVVLPSMRGGRTIIEVLADRVSTSCGYSIPRMELVEERDTLRKWVDGRSDADLDAYRARKNRTSIDGLPALDPAPAAPSGSARP